MTIIVGGIRSAFMAVLLFLPAMPTSASTITYTLRTVADGQIGAHRFYEALVTIRMTADTRTVQQEPGQPLVYANYRGETTVIIDDQGTVIEATFLPGEVYVRYDTANGIAGFGSHISPTYPVALDCSNYAYPDQLNYHTDCLVGDSWGNYDYYNGTLAMLLSGLSGDISGQAPSDATMALPVSLSKPTLLTGRAHTCAGAYTVIGRGVNDGDLGVCAARAPIGLRTNKGLLFLQDTIGGATTGGYGGWSNSNSGFLNVELLADQ